MIPRSWNHIIGQIISWSRGISLLDVMNIWLQPLTPQVFKVMPQEAWMPTPRVVTPNIHWYWFLVLGIRTPKHHTGDNTHWPTKLDMVDKTSVQRRFFGCNCAARFVLKSNWKKGEKRHIRARNMIFLGLIFSGPQSLVIKGGSLTQPAQTVWMSDTMSMVEQESLVTEDCCFRRRAWVSPASPRPPREGWGCLAPTSAPSSSPPARPSGRSERSLLKSFKWPFLSRNLVQY